MHFSSWQTVHALRRLDRPTIKYANTSIQRKKKKYAWLYIVAVVGVTTIQFYILFLQKVLSRKKVPHPQGASEVCTLCFVANPLWLVHNCGSARQGRIIVSFHSRIESVRTKPSAHTLISIKLQAAHRFYFFANFIWFSETQTMKLAAQCGSCFELTAKYEMCMLRCWMVVLCIAENNELFAYYIYTLSHTPQIHAVVQRSYGQRQCVRYKRAYAGSSVCKAHTLKHCFHR